jgi:hypothetical protein
MIAMVEDGRAEVADLCRRYGVERLDVFGSAAWRIRGLYWQRAPGILSRAPVESTTTPRTTRAKERPLTKGYLLLALGVLLGAGLIAALAYILGFDRAQQLADVANKLTLAAATIVGGYWVYDRSVRERVGESRLDLTVSAEALSPRGSRALYLSVTVGAENVGTEKVDLDHDYCALTVATHEARPAASDGGATAAESAGGRPEPAEEAAWRPLGEGLLSMGLSSGE